MIPNVSNLKFNASNPRTIKKDQFERLKKSLTGFTKMLEIRPIAYDEDNIIWGGNMRYRALQQLVAENLVEDNPKYYKLLENFTEEEKKEFAIRDNVELGDWDFDVLANEWDNLPLLEWGIDISLWDASIENNNEEINTDVLADGLDTECPKCHFIFKK